MAKLGKWIGGGLGWAFGGPIGAIIGFSIGSLFDGKTELKHPNQQTTGPGDFSVSLLVLSAAVMKADGKLLKSELNFIKQFFVTQFGEEVAQQKMLIFQEILKQEIPLQEVCLQIKQSMDRSSQLQLMHYLFGISLADGNAHHKEIEIIQTISRFLGINSREFNSVKAMFVKETDSNYKILEIPVDSSIDEIKKAYRTMATKYHPDKVSHLGEDIQKAAKEKFQQVSNAYSAIKKEKGFN